MTASVGSMVLISGLTSVAATALTSVLPEKERNGRSRHLCDLYVTKSDSDASP